MSKFCTNCGTKNPDEAKFCKNCGNKLDKEKSNIINNNNELGFTWWNIWAWLGLTLGNLMIIGVLSDITDVIGIALGFIINTILNILILKYNKYAFLIATVLSFNPLYWIINGIYLKNRWYHPKVNKDQTDLTTINRIENSYIF